MSYQPHNRTNLLQSLTPFNTAYSPKLIIAMSFPEHSPYTDQSFADECDVNTIMSRYQSTGEMPILNPVNGQFLDVIGMDFQSHMDQINEARELFGQLPSKLRDRFDNNPAEFLTYAADPFNRSELDSLGLLAPDLTEFTAPRERRSQSRTDGSSSTEA